MHKYANRWFHLAVDLDQDPVAGAYTGKNYLDLAVSASGDPTGSWTIYRIPGMNDGTEGAPNHNCAGSPYFADSPHIDVDLFDASKPARQVCKGELGFTLWPALSAGNQFETAAGGSNYFVSSNAVFDDASGDSEEIIVWH